MSGLVPVLCLGRLTDAPPAALLHEVKPLPLSRGASLLCVALGASLGVILHGVI